MVFESSFSKSSVNDLKTLCYIAPTERLRKPIKVTVHRKIHKPYIKSMWGFKNPKVYPCIFKWIHGLQIKKFCFKIFLSFTFLPLYSHCHHAGERLSGSRESTGRSGRPDPGIPTPASSNTPTFLDALGRLWSLPSCRPIAQLFGTWFGTSFIILLYFPVWFASFLRPKTAFCLFLCIHLSN